MRFPLVEQGGLPTLADRILDHLHEHGPSTTDVVRAGVNVRRSNVLRTLGELEGSGRITKTRSGKRDAAGRTTREEAWNLTSEAGSPLTLTSTEPRTYQDEPNAGHRDPSRVPTPLGGNGTDGSPDDPQEADDDIPF